MQKTMLLSAAFFLWMVLSACVAPKTKGVSVNQDLVDKERQYQMELTLQQQLKYQQKLNDLAWPLLQSALPICDAQFKQAQLGFDAASLADFPKEYHEAGKKLLVMDEHLRVISVTANSPAAKAGLLSGDKIVSLNGVAPVYGKKATQQFFKQMEEGLKFKKDVVLVVERGDAKLNLALTGQELCYFPVVLTMNDAVNAYADGVRVVITKGMMRFTENDLELSMVVAHEMGHNMMEHIDAKKSNYWLGTIADIAAAVAGVNTQGSFGRMGVASYSQEFEAEADYVGLYILALDKQDIEQSANFWRRMAAEHPRGIQENHGASHPSTAERFVAIEETVREIRMKQKAGFPLEPDKK